MSHTLYAMPCHVIRHMSLHDISHDMSCVHHMSRYVIHRDMSRHDISYIMMSYVITCHNMSYVMNVISHDVIRHACHTL